MKCIYCAAADTRVIDSRLSPDNSSVRRRRGCDVCNKRFTTYERFELIMPRVLKNSGRKESFDQDKIRTGLNRACNRISNEKIDICINQIITRIHDFRGDEITTKLIGQYVMDALLELDEVAYVRFSSVYLDYNDVSEFKNTIDAITKHKSPSNNL